MVNNFIFIYSLLICYSSIGSYSDHTSQFQLHLIKHLFNCVLQDVSLISDMQIISGKPDANNCGKFSDLSFVIDTTYLHDTTRLNLSFSEEMLDNHHGSLYIPLEYRSITKKRSPEPLPVQYDVLSINLKEIITEYETLHLTSQNNNDIRVRFFYPIQTSHTIYQTIVIQSKDYQSKFKILIAMDKNSHELNGYEIW